jgi:hypothetical protein
MTTKTICDRVRDAFPFSVDKFRLTGPDNLKTPHYGLFRSDSLECVGNAVSSGYVPHNTLHVCQLVEAAQDAFQTDCEITTTWKDGHVVIMRPSNVQRLAVFGTDTVWPRLSINAGYGGSAFSASLGFYRDVCRNLAMFRQVRGTSVSIRHTESFNSKHEKLVDKFSQLLSAWNNVTEKIETMSQKQVVISEVLRDMYPETNDMTKRAQTNRGNEISAIVGRIIDERSKLGLGPIVNQTVSAWELFNGVQGYVQHNARRRGDVTPIDRALASWDDRRVTRIEELLAV